jgi:hypothetical protein
MQREFGRRTLDRPSQRAGGSPTPPQGNQPAADPALIRRAVLAVTLTIAVVGGMFLIPALGQCDGRKGALGLDWCRLMKASVEGASRGVAIGRGTAPAANR